MNAISVLTFVNVICFFGYGLSCLFSSKMQSEFNRFGLSVFQRRLTGILQVLGALGLVIGYFATPILAFLAALGLSLLMLFGFLVRLKIKDDFYDSAPSFVFMVLNGYLAYALVGLL